MEYRRLGKNGPEVSVIALGCGGFEGMPRAEVGAIFDRALARGVNFFDLFTADPEIRANVGAAIAGRRERVVIQGHIGSAWVDGQYLRTRDPALTRAAFEEELRLLGTDHVDIGMIHYVDAAADWKEIAEGPFLEYVRGLKRSGRIGCIGLGSHNPDVAREAVRSGLIDVLMFAVNPCYDMQPGDEDLEKLWADESYAHALRNQDAARAALYELCESRGVGIDVMKAYGGGDLLDAALSPFGKAFTPVQCIHYALTRPAAAAVMCGCKTPAELDAALAWLDATPEQRDYSGVLSGLDRFTFEGHCLYCGHCAPCPAGIDVAAVTRLLNLCRAQGRVPESERGHYDLLAHHGGECVGCGRCEERCPFGVEIRANMRAAAQVFGK